MQYENIFDQEGLQKTIDRINKLTPDTPAQWGKMNVSQMLAHLSVAYEMDHEDIHKKPNGFTKLLLKLFVKKVVCGPKPYAKNNRTAPQFVISDERDFNVEKTRLINYMNATADIGAANYDGRENQSFGKLSTQEWNTLYSKHLDHHLTQFGV